MRIRFIAGRNGNLVVLGKRRDPSGRARAHAHIVPVATKSGRERREALRAAMKTFEQPVPNTQVSVSEHEGGQ